MSDFLTQLSSHIVDSYLVTLVALRQIKNDQTTIEVDQLIDIITYLHKKKLTASRV